MLIAFFPVGLFLVAGLQPERELPEAGVATSNYQTNLKACSGSLVGAQSL